MTARVEKLPSGLTVVTDRMEHLRTASLGIWVGAGSRNEDAHEHGIAHFLEHMAFKGTSRRNARQIVEEIEAAGGDLNASTGLESTGYYARVLGEDVPLALDILSDILTGLAVEGALDVVAAAHAGRRVAILGEMLELGPGSAALHARCGHAAARAGVALLITVGGPPARALGVAAVDAGLPPAAVLHCDTSEEAAAAAPALVRAGDLVLVKGSRGIGLERVVQALSGGPG
jgi:hypothetical protein